MKSVLTGLFLIIALTGCKSSQKSDFVTVADGIFQVSGEPYYYIGANYWYGAITWQPGRIWRQGAAAEGA